MAGTGLTGAGVVGGGVTGAGIVGDEVLGGGVPASKATVQGYDISPLFNVLRMVLLTASWRLRAVLSVICSGHQLIAVGLFPVMLV